MKKILASPKRCSLNMVTAIDQRTLGKSNRTHFRSLLRRQTERVLTRPGLNIFHLNALEIQATQTFFQLLHRPNLSRQHQV